jgi:hypothetical protein
MISVRTLDGKKQHIVWHKNSNHVITLCGLKGDTDVNFTVVTEDNKQYWTAECKRCSVRQELVR